MTIVTYDHYLTTFEYRAPESARGMDIHYRASDTTEAARAAWRFYESRRSMVPEFFGTLLCVKIYGFTVREIDEKGNYLSRSTMCLFEWKCDMGWTYEDRVGYLEAQLERSRRPGTI